MNINSMAPFQDYGHKLFVWTLLVHSPLALHEVRNDIDRQRKHDGGILLRRNSVQSLTETRNILHLYHLHHLNYIFYDNSRWEVKYQRFISECCLENRVTSVSEQTPEESRLTNLEILNRISLEKLNVFFQIILNW